MNRMGDLINKCTIWKFLGVWLAMSGLGCFGFSSTYKISFGKLDICGLLVYLLISSIMLCLIYFVKGIEVPEGFQGVVEPILFLAICLISIGLDKLVPGKSDALSIISYGLFALMSTCTSRKPELGFETGFFAFFLSLFSEQLFKTNWKLSPIALGFCLAAFLLRRRSQSGGRNGDRPVRLIIETARDNLDLEGQHSSEQSLLPNRNQQQTDDEEETRSSFLMRHHLPSTDGQVSEENISDGGNEQNNEREEDSTPTLAAESSYSSEQDHVSSANYQNGLVQNPRLGLFQRGRRRMTPVIQNISSSLRRHSSPESWAQEQVSSGNNQNGWMHSSAEAELLSAEASGLRRRRRWMTAGIQNIPSRVGATLGRWRWQVVPAFCLFLRKK